MTYLYKELNSIIMLRTEFHIVQEPTILSKCIFSHFPSFPRMLSVKQFYSIVKIMTLSSSSANFHISCLYFLSYYKIVCLVMKLEQTYFCDSLY